MNVIQKNQKAVGLVDWRTTEIGRQNWEVCHRILIHDLVDLKSPAVNRILAFYNITVLPNGTHTAALPRFYVFGAPQPKVKKTGKVNGKKATG